MRVRGARARDGLHDRRIADPLDRLAHLAGGRRARVPRRPDAAASRTRFISSLSRNGTVSSTVIPGGRGRSRSFAPRIMRGSRGTRRGRSGIPRRAAARPSITALSSRSRRRGDRPRGARAPWAGARPRADPLRRSPWRRPARVPRVKRGISGGYPGEIRSTFTERSLLGDQASSTGSRHDLRDARARHDVGVLMRARSRSLHPRTRRRRLPRLGTAGLHDTGARPSPPSRARARGDPPAPLPAQKRRAHGPAAPGHGELVEHRRAAPTRGRSRGRAR
jgi:hypothetical protein